ncbi:protein of unknown function [Paraburkholderia dioscoreae]|uniref:Uncharacterized protein n=1 Tax=Paraburkholderia dioscoreae TaxID=2604047 RepID=A0A5Q4YSY6_9BURK|nr:protein of unknown function [Paraburkholderia dioscoreae]
MPSLAQFRCGMVVSWSETMQVQLRETDMYNRQLHQPEKNEGTADCSGGKGSRADEP